MPTKMSNSYREHDRGSMIVGTSYRKGVHEATKTKKHNQQMEHERLELRKEWVLVPPSNHTIMLHQDRGQVPAGLVLSVPHEIGCMILHKRLGRIIERDNVTVDVVLDGDIEGALEAMELLAVGEVQ
jgi:hypothetical protein